VEDIGGIRMEEYDDKRVLIHMHIHSFVCRKCYRVEKKIRKCYRVEKIVRYGVNCSHHIVKSRMCSDVSQWDHLLVYIISEKFPQEYKTNET
jgi:hypothetical protein